MMAGRATETADEPAMGGQVFRQPERQTDLMKKNARASWFHGAAVVGLLASSAVAQTPTVVYDNSSSPLNRYFASTSEFGDQINIGSGWTASSFRFEYFAANLSGGEMARVRFFKNDGVPIEGTDIQAPGGLLYESPKFPLQNGNIPVSIENLPAGIDLPESFTWTVSVTGLSGSEVFGLVLYDPPTVGTSLDDIWQFTINGWQLTQIPGLPTGSSANFGAVLTAVPEPGPLALLALGGLALLFKRRSIAR